MTRRGALAFFAVGVIAAGSIAAGGGLQVGAATRVDKSRSSGAFVAASVTRTLAREGAVDALVVVRDEGVVAARKAGVLASVGRGVAVVRDYSALPVMLVRVSSSSALRALQAHSAVTSIAANERRVTNLAQSLPLVRQPEAAAAGYRGNNASVAVLDTGVDYTRAAFGCNSPGSPASCKVIYAHDFAPNDNQRDADGHGTNVAGIVVGVAPAAKVLALDVFTGNSAFDDDIIAAINFTISHQAQYNIRAINMSLGQAGSYNTSECASSPYASVFRSARGVGILPVLSAGNSAVKNGVFTNGVSSPACAPGAVRVGAVYDANVGGLIWGDPPFQCTDNTSAADKITCFSQSGPLLSVLAPGALITAAGSTYGGTSQAAPHVAGAVALLAAAHPPASADAIEAAIKGSGPNITDARNNVTRHRLDVMAAINASPSVRDTSLATGDFNGDGRRDLAIGAPGEDIGTKKDAGFVMVVNGAAAGLQASNIGFDQDQNLAGDAEAGDQVGAALAAGDFNGDGFSDLAIGAPGEDIGAKADAGFVMVVYGSATGLKASNIGFDQDTNLAGGAEAGDQVGAALAAGNFNGDTRQDLAIGAPGEDIGAKADAGFVMVVHGAAGGLQASNIGFDQDTNLAGDAEAGDLVGAALAAGDFTGDGKQDLAIGAPGEDIGATSNAGFVMVVHGAAGGLQASNIGLDQNTNLAGDAEAGDEVGAALAAGDFNGDGKRDLAIGAPGEDIGAKVDAGFVMVVHGAAGGLQASNIGFDQDTNLAGGAEPGDQVGAALAAGDFNGDARQDLAIGAPGEDVGNQTDAGFVMVVNGSAAGLQGSNVGFDQDTNLAGGAESGDQVGASLAAGNFNGDARQDLAIGAPGEDIGATTNAGFVMVVHGAAAGLQASNIGFDQDTNLAGSAEAGDQVGGRT